MLVIYCKIEIFNSTPRIDLKKILIQYSTAHARTHTHHAIERVEQWHSPQCPTNNIQKRNRNGNDGKFNLRQSSENREIFIIIFNVYLNAMNRRRCAPTLLALSIDNGFGNKIDRCTQTRTINSNQFELLC